MSVFEAILGKRKTKPAPYDSILELLHKFMIESKSQAPTKGATAPQLAVMTMYTYGALVYLCESQELPDNEYVAVLSAYLQHQGLSDKQSSMEARIIVEQAKDPDMQWGLDTGYNSSMYWHQGQNTDAPKALARLLKTTR